MTAHYAAGTSWVRGLCSLPWWLQHLAKFFISLHVCRPYIKSTAHQSVRAELTVTSRNVDIHFKNKRMKCWKARETQAILKYVENLSGTGTAASFLYLTRTRKTGCWLTCHYAAVCPQPLTQAHKFFSSSSFFFNAHIHRGLDRARIEGGYCRHSPLSAPWRHSTQSSDHQATGFSI